MSRRMARRQRGTLHAKDLAVADISLIIVGIILEDLRRGAELK